MSYTKSIRPSREQVFECRDICIDAIRSLKSTDDRLPLDWVALSELDRVVEVFDFLDHVIQVLEKIDEWGL
jgi:hypothetical protein